MGFSFRAKRAMVILLAAVMLLAGAAAAETGENAQIMEYGGPVQVTNMNRWEYGGEDVFVVDVNAADPAVSCTFYIPKDDEMAEAFQELTHIPDETFPLELKPGDGFTLEGGRATRANATPVLTLANGNVLNLTCKPAGHKELCGLTGKEDLSVTVNWDGTTGTLKVTAQDGSSVEMTITKVTKKRPLAADTRLRVEYVAASAPAITMSQVPYSEVMYVQVDMSDGSTWGGYCACADEFLIAAAQKLLPGATITIAEERDPVSFERSGLVTVAAENGYSITFGLDQLRDICNGIVTITAGDGRSISVPAYDIRVTDTANLQ